MQKNLLRAFIIITLVVGASLLLGFAVNSLLHPAETETAGNDIPEGGEAFPPLTLKNLNGQDVDLLKAHPGKTLLVNYWATWCPPCISELPSLMKLKARRQSENFDVVLISLDFPKDTETLKNLMKRFGLAEYDTLYMTDATQWSSLKGRGLPITVLVGPEGQIISRIVGAIDWEGPAGDDFLKNMP